MRTVPMNVFVAISASILISGSAVHAGAIPETGLLRAADGQADDLFGTSIAVSGSLLLIGAPGHDDVADGAGAAYLFDLSTGQLIHKLLADDGGVDHQFGHAVALSADVAIIGAPRAVNAANEHVGAVYLFDVDTGDQIAKLLANDGAIGDLFGSSVASDGVHIVAGARNDQFDGSASGAAYIFDAQTHAQLHKLTPDDRQAFMRFGGDVAIEGDVIVVGAIGATTSGSSTGAAYVFSASTGQQLHELVPAGSLTGDDFGLSVSINSGLALIGAHNDDNANGFAAGIAYFFDPLAGTEGANLIADDGDPVDFFGWSVALGPSLAIAGAIADDGNGENAGAAYAYDRSTGDQVAKLLPLSGQSEDLAGYDTAIVGNVALVSAPGDDEHGEDAGAVYVFDLGFLCPADFMAPYGVVNADDLFALLGAWGSCPASCPEDLDDSGVVDADDLFLLLGAWGSCP